MSQASVVALQSPFIDTVELRSGAVDASNSSMSRFAAERLWNTLEAIVVTAPPEPNQTATAVLGLPWFANDARQSCLLLGSTTHGGTCEVWHVDPERDQLRLSSGYFGRWEEFRRITALTRFSAGEGLPGRVWKTGCPILLEDLSESKAFLRAEAAQSIGLHYGLGLPVRYPTGFGVVALLSSRTVPLGRAVDLWQLSQSAGLEHLQGLDFAASSREHALAFDTAHRLALDSATRFAPSAFHSTSTVAQTAPQCGFAWPSRDERGGIYVATVVG